MHKNLLSTFDTPAYSLQQGAHYVGVPHATLRAWAGVNGLIALPTPHNLSFNNLVEAHILKAMRRTHNLSLQSIRKGLQKLGELRKTAHPLLDEHFGTDGVGLCIYEEDQVVSLNKNLQTVIKEYAELYLRRIERDDSGRATRLFPFVYRDEESEPRQISIAPTVSFGRPVLVGTGVSTAVIAGRFAARDSVADLSLEYAVSEKILEDAIRWEMLKGKAA